MVTAKRNVATTAWALVGLCAGMGALHFVKPESFDDLIPPLLPGSARSWTYGSGVAELAVAGLLAAAPTRRAGGYAAAALFIGVFPGNLWMAWRWRHRSWIWQMVSLGRLPLQGDLIRRALIVAREG